MVANICELNDAANQWQFCCQAFVFYQSCFVKQPSNYDLLVPCPSREKDVHNLPTKYSCTLVLCIIIIIVVILHRECITPYCLHVLINAAPAVTVIVPDPPRMLPTFCIWLRLYWRSSLASSHTLSHLDCIAQPAWSYLWHHSFVSVSSVLSWHWFHHCRALNFFVIWSFLQLVLGWSLSMSWQLRWLLLFDLQCLM